MSGRVLQLQGPVHRLAFDLLPWYAAGTLDAAESELVRDHVGQCPACQRELEWLSDLATAHAADGRTAPADASWARLQRRLGGESRFGDGQRPAAFVHE